MLNHNIRIAAGAATLAIAVAVSGCGGSIDDSPVPIPTPPPGGGTGLPSPNELAEGYSVQVDGAATTLKYGAMPAASGAKPQLTGAPARIVAEAGEKVLLLYTAAGASSPSKLFFQVRGADTYYEVDLSNLPAKSSGSTPIVLKTVVPPKSAGVDVCADVAVGDGQGNVSDPQETCVDAQEPSDGDEVVGGPETPAPPVDDGSARVCFYPYMNKAKTLYTDAEGQQYRNSAEATSKSDSESGEPTSYVVTYNVNTFSFQGQATLLWDEANPAWYDLGSVGYADEQYINNNYSPGLAVPFYLFPGQTLVQQITNRFVDEVGENRTSTFTYQITHTGRVATGSGTIGCQFVTRVGDTELTRVFAYETGALVGESVRYKGVLYSAYGLVGGVYDDAWIDAYGYW